MQQVHAFFIILKRGVVQMGSNICGFSQLKATINIYNNEGDFFILSSFARGGAQKSSERKWQFGAKEKCCLLVYCSVSVEAGVGVYIWPGRAVRNYSLTTGLVVARLS